MTGYEDPDTTRTAPIGLAAFVGAGRRPGCGVR